MRLKAPGCAVSSAIKARPRRAIPIMPMALAMAPADGAAGWGPREPAGFGKSVMDRLSLIERNTTAKASLSHWLGRPVLMSYSARPARNRMQRRDPAPCITSEIGSGGLCSWRPGNAAGCSVCLTHMQIGQDDRDKICLRRQVSRNWRGVAHNIAHQAFDARFTIATSFAMIRRSRSCIRNAHCGCHGHRPRRTRGPTRGDCHKHECAKDADEKAHGPILQSRGTGCQRIRITSLECM